MMNQPVTPPSFAEATRLTLRVAATHARTCVFLSAPFGLLIGVSAAIGRSLAIDVDPLTASARELFGALAAGRAGVGVLALVGIFVLPPTLGALSLLGSAAVAGDALETHGVVRRVLDRGTEVVGTFVLTVLVLPVAAIVIGVVGLAAGAVAGPEAAFAALLFMTLVLAVVSLYLLIRLSLAVPVVIREGLDTMAALARSWDLAAGHWWWMFGVNVPGVLLALIGAAAWLGLLGEMSAIATAIVSGGLGVAAASLLGVAAGVCYEARAEVKPPAELLLPEERPGVPAE